MTSKNRLVRVLLLAVTVTWSFCYLRAQELAPRLDDPEIERRVSALLGQMTLEEKIGQLVRSSAGDANDLGKSGRNFREQIIKGQLASLENLTGAAHTNALQKLAVEQSRLHIPVLFGLDVIHGYRTIFPVPLAMASTWDPPLVERASRIAAKEATSEGIRSTYSPMVDIARDARWGRIVEGAGEDPYLGSAMAAAYVRGYQGARLDDPKSMMACLKHFVGYGAAEGGRDYNSVDMSERMLRQVYLPPFQAGVEAGVGSVMSGFNSLNGVPATSDWFTLTHILREEWGFQGVVISDYGSVRETIAHGIALDGRMAASKALLAGLDMDLEGNNYAPYLAELVRSGTVPESAIDQAVRRVLRVKFALGLFDHPYTPEPAENAKSQLDPSDVEFARTVAERSFVLLKNESARGNTLPFGPEVHSIALIGPLADSASDMLGPWHAKGDAGDVVTLRAALVSRMQQSGGQVLFAKGTEILTATQDDFAAAVSAAKQADVVVMALGEDAWWMSAEAASRAHLGLPGNQQQLLEAVASTGKPIVLIVFSGRPLTLDWAAGHIPAILQAWFPGIQAGPALVRTLFGDVSPGGKLTVTIPHSVGQEPLYYDALNTGRPADGIDLSRPPHNSDEKYHSRYVDEPNAALFPFGYGLSYTKFKYSPLELSTTQLSASGLNQKTAQELHVSTTVKNTGARTSDEIVELYLRLRGTSVALPVKQLKGFRRLGLAPGESKRIEFTVGRDELAFWNIDMRDVVEPALATVWIGPSSSEGESADFVISK
jgi:beta-glucosidase